MKTLLILRHARATSGHSNLADRYRPLDERGVLQASLVGKRLTDDALVPQRILSSVAVRAEQTARLAARACGAAEPRLESSLYLAPAGEYLRLLRETPSDHERVLVVGHCPGVEELVKALSGTSTGMPPACLVHVRCAIDGWQALGAAGSATLAEVWYA